MGTINFQGIREAEGLKENLSDVKGKIEERINLAKYNTQKNVVLNGNKIMRICLLAGLSSSEPRSLEELELVQLSKTSNRIFDSFFTTHNLSTVYSALLKIRYSKIPIDWDNLNQKSKIFNAEMLREGNCC
ncbi:hypothetical protein MASR2M47_03240 [Draconibacterium sp.]